MNGQETPDYTFESGAEFEEWLVERYLGEPRRHAYGFALVLEPAVGCDLFCRSAERWIGIRLRDGGTEHAWRIIADRASVPATVRQSVPQLLGRLMEGCTLVNGRTLVDGYVLVEVSETGAATARYVNDGSRP